MPQENLGPVTRKRWSSYRVANRGSHQVHRAPYTVTALREQPAPTPGGPHPSQSMQCFLVSICNSFLLEYDPPKKPDTHTWQDVKKEQKGK